MFPIVAAVLPIILVICVGVLVRRLGLVDAETARRINRLVFWVLFPCLLITKLGESTHLRDGALFANLPWAALIGMATAIALTMAAFFAVLGRGASDRIGSVFSVAFRSNGAFIGLPLTALLAENQVIGEADVTVFLILLAGTIPIFNVVSVIGFILPQHGLGWRSLKPSVLGLLRNPILWGCGLGLLLARMPAGVHAWFDTSIIERTMVMIGKPAIPLALIGAGASLRFSELTSIAWEVWWATAWKLLLMPILALTVATLCGADQRQLTVLTVLAACPSAVAIVPMASELGGDVRRAATGVVLTTLLSPLTIVIWLFWYLG